MGLSFGASRTFLRVVIAATMLLTVAVVTPTSALAARPSPTRVLVFHRTAGFAHDSIPAGVAAITDLGSQFGFAVDSTTDPLVFNDENLSRYDAVVFLSTTGNVIPGADQRAAFERYIRAGGGFFGIHAASDMGASVRNTWPWYMNLVGAAFKGHTATRVWSDTVLPTDLYAGPLSEAPFDATPAGDGIVYATWEPAKVIVEDPSSPTMQGWGRSRVHIDEWYGFLTNPRPNVHVIASLDETTYNPAAGAMGDDHPITWCQSYDGGRSVYTGLGHTTTAWSNGEFLKLIRGGIQMATGEKWRC
jgi:cytochrome c